MDIFCDSEDISSRFEQYVVDLRRLFVFHGIACGGAEGFVALGVKLEESKAFRLDLPALLRNMHDLAGHGITAEEMLTMLALASGGADLVDGRVETVGLMRHVTLLRVLVAGAGEWREWSAPGQERQAVSPAELGERAPVEPLPGVAIELALEQLRRQVSAMDRRMDQLEPAVGVAATVAMGEADGPAMREFLPVGIDEPAVPRAARIWGGAGGALLADRLRAETRRYARAIAGVAPVAGRASARVYGRASAAARALPARVRLGRWLPGAVAAVLFVLIASSVVRVVSSLRARTIFAKAAAAPAVTRPARVAASPMVARAVAVQPKGTDAEVPMEAPAKAARVEATAVAKRAASPARAVAAKAPAVAARAPAEDAGPAIVPVKPAVMERNLVASRKPVFPAAALAKGMDGTVVLNTFIAKNGSVSRMDVVSGAPPFIDSAMAAVSWRRYRPYLLRGRPVAVVTPVTVVYRLP